MNRMFVNRERELKFFNDKYRSKGFDFIVIYGRRRVGKTELVKQFIKDKKNIYFLADKRGTEFNIDRFKQKISEFLDEPRVELDTLEAVFSYLLKKIGDQRLIICIDEFSYLIEKDDSIPSVFQLIIDEILNKSNIMLILLGSSVSLMESGVLSSKSPLYGRRTGQFKIEPLSFSNILEFFPNRELSENVLLYSVFGGIPFYLNKIDNGAALDNIKSLILKKGEILYEEIDFLLKEELREPSTYKSILEAIASGCSKIGEISNKAKVETRDIDKYLKVLINLGYVEKEISPTEKEKSKKTIYRIKDNFFKFWFKFCSPKLSELEIGREGEVFSFIKNNLNSFVGIIFEEICKEFLGKNRIFEYKKVGRWWGYKRIDNKREEIEIDICAVNEKTKEILFGECKWQDNVNVESIMKDLREKIEYVEWNNEKRKESYAVFAKSFSKKIDEFEGKKIYCFDLKDIEKRLKI